MAVRGVVVTDLHRAGDKSGKRWLIRVRDPIGKRYVSRRFERQAEGLRWGTQELARLQAARDPALPVVTLPGLLESYLADLERRGRRAEYIEQVRRILNDAAEHGVADLTSRALLAQVERWLTLARSLHPRRPVRMLAPATLNNYRRAIRGMVHWAQRRQLLEVDHLYGLEPIEQDRPLKPVLSIDELRLVLAQCRRQWDGYGRLVALLIYSGMRLREACHLQWQHIDWPAQMIAVRLGDYSLKRRRERLVPLQDELRALLQADDGMCRANPWPRVIDPAIGDMPRDQHRRRFRSLLRSAGVQRLDITPHSCRHSWISIMLATGENALAVRDWAGHRSLSTTDTYALGQNHYRAQAADWGRGRMRLLT